jgi:methylated-DNA-protein-cysteine methyltransferase-like protein
MAASGRAFARIYRAARAIPRGRVATYGQVARMAGLPNGARTVGWALRALDETREPGVPWHRVVGAGGAISLGEGLAGAVQRSRLKAEGVRLRNGRVPIERFGLGAESALTSR